MLEALLIIINLFFVPMITTGILFFKKDKENKSFVRFVLIYCINVVVILAFSYVIVLLINILTGLMFAISSAAYTIISLIVSLIISFIVSKIKVSFVELTRHKDEE